MLVCFFLCLPLLDDITGNVYWNGVYDLKSVPVPSRTWAWQTLRWCCLAVGCLFVFFLLSPFLAFIKLKWLTPPTKLFSPASYSEVSCLLSSWSALTCSCRSSSPFAPSSSGTSVVFITQFPSLLIPYALLSYFFFLKPYISLTYC